MSYLAIARKYRPSTFDEIVGQDHVTRTLRNAIEARRIHHAFLFTGARGVGKTTAARALARALNCEGGPTAEPCGACTSCREITSGSSPDLIEIDGASNNSVDDIRELRDTVHYAPTRGQYKIYLIDEVHMLSKAAFNALLKTLEEPPPHVVFIFATTEPNKILDTILSRVQRFDFKRIPVPGVVDRLREIADTEGAELSDNALRMIARAGEGSMRDAQSLLDKVISFGGSSAISDEQVAETLGLIDRSLLYAMLEGLVSGRPELCLDAIATVYAYGYELSQFTGEMLEVLRNATFVRMSQEARRHVDVSGDELERLDALLDGVDPEVLTRTFAALLEVHDQVSRASRPRIVLEMAVARLATRRSVQPVSALLSRLEDLERRLRQSGAGAPPAGQRRSPRSAEPRRSRREPGPSRGGARPRSRSRQGASSWADDDGSSDGSGPWQVGAGPPAPPADAGGLGIAADAPRERVAREAASMVIRAPATEPDDASSEEPVDASPEERWAALCVALRTHKGPARRLVDGEPTWEGQRLRVVLPAGRPLAEGRRAVGLPEVADAVARYYPEGTTLDVVAKEGTGTAADQQAALQREVLEDPACKRIIQTLGAELERVTSLRERDGGSDGL